MNDVRKIAFTAHERDLMRLVLDTVIGQVAEDERLASSKTWRNTALTWLHGDVVALRLKFEE